MEDFDDEDQSFQQIIYTDKETVKCSDGNEHPTVYYTVPKGGSVQCGYCNRKWIRK